MKLVCSVALVIGAAAKNDDTVIQPSVRGSLVSGAGRSEATSEAAPDATAINDPTTRQLQGPTYCSCSACDQFIWDTYAGAHQCGARIEWKSSQWGGNLSHEDGE